MREEQRYRFVFRFVVFFVAFFFVAFFFAAIVFPPRNGPFAIGATRSRTNKLGGG
jgi:hypothetical protein